MHNEEQESMDLDLVLTYDLFWFQNTQTAPPWRPIDSLVPRLSQLVLRLTVLSYEQGKPENKAVQRIVLTLGQLSLSIPTCIACFFFLVFFCLIVRCELKNSVMVVWSMNNQIDVNLIICTNQSLIFSGGRAPAALMSSGAVHCLWYHGKRHNLAPLGLGLHTKVITLLSCFSPGLLLISIACYSPTGLCEQTYLCTFDSLQKLILILILMGLSLGFPIDTDPNPLKASRLLSSYLVTSVGRLCSVLALCKLWQYNPCIMFTITSDHKMYTVCVM